MRNYVNKRRTVSSKMRPPDVDLTTWRSLVTLTTQFHWTKDLQHQILVRMAGNGEEKATDRFTLKESREMERQLKEYVELNIDVLVNLLVEVLLPIASSFSVK